MTEGAKDELKLVICAVLWVTLAFLLCGCSTLAPKETDDPLAFINRSEVVTEGTCTFKNGSKTAEFLCRVYESPEEELYLVVYGRDFTEPFIAFRVHEDGRLSETWRSEEKGASPNGDSQGIQSTIAVHAPTTEATTHGTSA